MVVAHRQREQQALQLAEHTGAAIVWDDGTLGCETNHRRAWARHTKTTPWAVVLEDDALPVDDFPQHLDRALQQAPTPIVSLYLGTGHPQRWQPAIQQALHTEAHWVTSTHLLHAVGVAIRTDLLPMQLPAGMPIDQAITHWARRHHHRVAYTRPSLVDHADEPTVIRQRMNGRGTSKPRRAWEHGTREHWTSSTTDLA